MAIGVVKYGMHVSEQWCYAAVGTPWDLWGNVCFEEKENDQKGPEKFVSPMQSFTECYLAEIGESFRFYTAVFHARLYPPALSAAKTPPVLQANIIHSVCSLFLPTIPAKTM